MALLTICKTCEHYIWDRSRNPHICGLARGTHHTYKISKAHFVIPSACPWKEKHFLLPTIEDYNAAIVAANETDAKDTLVAKCINNFDLEGHFDNGVCYIVREVSKKDKTKTMRESFSDEQLIGVEDKYGEITTVSHFRFELLEGTDSSGEGLSQ